VISVQKKNVLFSRSFRVDSLLNPSEALPNEALIL
jgi:hypothetical protein